MLLKFIREQTMGIFFLIMVVSMAGIIYIVYKDVWAEKKKKNI